MFLRAACAAIVAVVPVFEEECDQSREAAGVPDAASVWWRAQLRAREDAARVAGRITMAQVVAIAATFAAVGAIFGATSGWFQRGLHWIAASSHRSSPGACQCRRLRR